MEELREKYVNPFTDYGFKHYLENTVANNGFTDHHFLNELLKEEQGRITELTYLKFPIN